MAHCGTADARDLVKLGQVPAPYQLEVLVENAVAQAWQDFQNGRIAAAESAVGQLPESEIFIVPPARSISVRWWQLFLGGTMLLILTAMLLGYWQPPWLNGIKPVTLTEAQIQGFLNEIKTNQNSMESHSQRSYPGDPLIALSFCIVLPSRDLMSTNSLSAIHEEVFRATGFQPDDEKCIRVANPV